MHRAAIIAGLPDSPINPARDLAASDLPLPPRVSGRIESLARPRSLGNSHQLGDGPGVARDHDFLLNLQKRLGLRPSLAQVPDTDRLHDAKYIMFHTGARRIMVVVEVPVMGTTRWTIQRRMLRRPPPVRWQDRLSPFTITDLRVQHPDPGVHHEGSGRSGRPIQAFAFDRRAQRRGGVPLHPFVPELLAP